MADKTTQQLTIAVQVKDQLTKAMKRMGGSLDNFKKRGVAAFKKVGAEIRKFLTGNVAKLTALLTGGVLFVSAFNGAKDFAGAMSEVSTISSEVAGNLDHVTDQTKDLATRLGLDPVEAAAGLYQTLSAGISGTANALEVLEASSKLAIAGVAGTKESVDLVTSALNAYGFAATDAGRVSSILFKTVQLGKTTVAELAGSFGKAGPLAAQLGVSLEELSGAIAAITLTGSSTSESVTQIVAVMNSLLLKASEVDELFSTRLGKSFRVTDLRTRGLVAVLEDLQAATGGNKAEMIALLGSVEALNASIKLAGDSADETKRIMESLSGALAEAEEAAAMQRLQPFKVMEAQLNAARIATFSLARAFVFAFVGKSVNGIDDLEDSLVEIRSTIEELEPLADVAGKSMRSAIDLLKAFGFVAVRSAAEVARVTDALGLTKDAFDDLKVSADNLGDSAFLAFMGDFELTDGVTFNSLFKSLKDIEKLIAISSDSVSAVGNAPAPGGFGAGGETIDTQALISSRSELIQQSRELLVQQDALLNKYDGQRGALLLTTEAELARLESMAQANPALRAIVDLNKAQVEALKNAKLATIDAAEASDLKRKANREEAQALEDLRAAQDAANAARRASGNISFGLADGAKEALGVLRDDYQNGFNAAQDAIFAATDATANFFDSIITGSAKAKDALKDLLRDIGSAIARNLSNQAAASAVSGLGTIFGFADGGVIPGGLGNAMPVHGYASGGPVFNRPHMAVIGEGKYNEAAVPLPDGKRIPVDIRGGGAGGNVTQHISPTIQLSLNAPDAATGAQFLVREADTLAQIVAAKIAEGSSLRTVVASVPRGQVT